MLLNERVRAGREVREITEGGTKSKISREVQILPSFALNNQRGHFSY